MSVRYETICESIIMTEIDLETLLEEIHSLKQKARGLEKKNLQTLEKVTEKVLTKQKLQKRGVRHPYWYFMIGIIFMFFGFLGFFEAFSKGFILGSLLWICGSMVPSFWCVWRFLKT